MDNNEKLYGPEDVENFYGILYEFDEFARNMASLLSEVDRKDMDLTEQNLLNHYEMLLVELGKAYNAIDKYQAEMMQK